MRALRLDSLRAEEGALSELLGEVHDTDVFGRASLEDRLSAVRAEIDSLTDTPAAEAKVALIFGGRPVEGSRSVDAGLASTVISQFQNLVRTEVARFTGTRLGGRGPLPMWAPANLAIADVVRGSVGIVLEERSENGTLFDTAVADAIDSVTRIISSAAAADEQVFEEMISDVDPRLMGSLQRLFVRLDDAGATLRIVEREVDADMREADIRLARRRVDSTLVHEQENVSIVGELLGLLPEQKRFEMRLAQTGEIVRGAVSARLAERYVELIEKPDGGVVGRWWRTLMTVREVRRPNRPTKTFYTLVGLVRTVRPPQ